MWRRIYSSNNFEDKLYIDCKKLRKLNYSHKIWQRMFRRLLQMSDDSKNKDLRRFYLHSGI